MAQHTDSSYLTHIDSKVKDLAMLLNRLLKL